jgi:GNAT superfamily N-acetyltransferase
MTHSILQVKRDEPVGAREIEDLRAEVGWDRFEDKYDRVLLNSYAHFTARDEGRLVAFVNVISDGIGDAFLVDLLVHPRYQRRGLGRSLVEAAISEISTDGVRCIQVTFHPELEGFYRKCGFHVFKAGIIDNTQRETV